MKFDLRIALTTSINDKFTIKKQIIYPYTENQFRARKGGGTKKRRIDFQLNPQSSQILYHFLCMRTASIEVKKFNSRRAVPVTVLNKQRRRGDNDGCGNQTE